MYPCEAFFTGIKQQASSAFISIHPCRNAPTGSLKHVLSQTHAIGKERYHALTDTDTSILGFRILSYMYLLSHEAGIDFNIQTTINCNVKSAMEVRCR